MCDLMCVHVCVCVQDIDIYTDDLSIYNYQHKALKVLSIFIYYVSMGVLSACISVHRVCNAHGSVPTAKWEVEAGGFPKGWQDSYPGTKQGIRRAHLKQGRI